ncbi:MAG: extracellular solute-binding protein, partial [Clostridia bacterium]|nr:extracellular solute-binding protein [Clostridia bacterium]
MAKKFVALSCLALAGAFAFGSCSLLGGGGNSGDSSTSEGSTSGVNAPKAIEGLAAEYTPAVELVKKQQGVINVVLVFENTLPAWQALADEYQKMHKGVTITLNSNYSEADSYQQNLMNQALLDNPTWDIVQGNLFNGNAADECYNMNTAINTENAYAGIDEYGEARIWSEVLTSEAYLSSKSGSNSDTYIMNTEGLLTAWFVNTVALEAAAEKGYNDGVAENPTTWDELMSLCYYMEEAGYENPLGIALDRDSISASQFTWLLRIYGDYYYRGMYSNIMLSKNYEYDPTDINPESDLEFGIDGNAFFYSIFKDSDKTRYVGPLSDRFAEFIEQFQK